MRRVAIEVFTPPVLGPAFFWVPLVVRGRSPGDVFHLILAGAAFGLLLSVPYMAVMEVAFRLWCRPKSVLSVVLSTFLGACSGSVFGLLLAGYELFTFWLGVDGAVVGAITGALICLTHSPERPMEKN